MQQWVELLQTWEHVSAPELLQCKVWLLSTESPSDFWLALQILHQMPERDSDNPF